MWKMAAPRGQGACQISTIGTSTQTARAQRIIRKVSGGAYGKPNLATIKPVLHSRTKKTGMGESQGLDADAVVVVVEDIGGWDGLIRSPPQHMLGKAQLPES